jgi:Spy/CpxP family protein refolding chaperone
MIERTRYILAAALLLSPFAAHAQQAPAPRAALPAAASPVESFSGAPASDADEWFGDLLAFEPGDGDVLDGPALAEGGPGVDDPVAMDEAPGPDGQHRIVVRDVRRGPDGGMGPGLGFHHGGPGGPMARRGRAMAMRMRLAQLDLSDAQRAKLRDLHEAHARRAIQRRADMQLARLDLHKLMSADRPDPGAVNAQIDRLAKIHADGLKAAFEMRMQARAVLTPEQLRQLRSPQGPMRMQHEGPDTPY